MVLQPEEVESGEWMDEAGVNALVAGGLTCPDSAQGWGLYLERFGHGRNFARDIAPGLDSFGCAEYLESP